MENIVRVLSATLVLVTAKMQESKLWKIWNQLLTNMLQVAIKVRLHTAINRADFVSWWML